MTELTCGRCKDLIRRIHAKGLSVYEVMDASEMAEEHERHR